MPSETGVYNNGKSIIGSIDNMGEHFTSNSSIDTYYAGKWHIPSFSEINISGFTCLTGHIQGQGNVWDASIACAVEGFLWNRSSSDPFLLVCSFMNPHDICEWLRLNAQDPDYLRYADLSGKLQTEPNNFNYDVNEPSTVSGNRSSDEPAQNDWSTDHWKYYMYNYYRHVEMVDAEIGRVMQALEDSGLKDNTLVIYTSDHGEGLAHHQMVRKSMLYEEGARVPLMISWPGQIT